MKRFVQYLVENVKTYEYRIKIAGTIGDQCSTRIERHLERYAVESYSKPKTTPIQEHPMGFPVTISNSEVTIIDVETAYPASIAEIKSIVANCSGRPLDHVVIETDLEPVETEDKEYKTLLGNEYDKDKQPQVYGDEYNKGLIKDLLKSRDDLAKN